jgi:flagellar biosynthetic protein FliR
VELVADPGRLTGVVSLELPIDTAWAVGLMLAIIRVATFVVTSPIIGKTVGSPARVAFSVAIGTAISYPVSATLEVPELIGAAVVNAIVGGVLGFVSGLIIQLFATAGGVVDFVSGLSVATVFDPLSGSQGAVFQRLFHLTAVVMFLVSGGLTLIVGALFGSVRVLPLEGGLAPMALLPETVVTLVSTLFRSGVELVLPIMGVLLMLELALGLASRFSPQANILMLGLPMKILATITVVGAAFVLFPDAMSEVQRTFGEASEAALRGLGATGEGVTTGGA